MNILRKRLLRDLKHSLSKYLLILAILILGTAIFVAIADSTDSVTKAIEKLQASGNVEDGYFLLQEPLDTLQMQELLERGVTLEKNFYINIKEGGIVYRIFRNREKINLIQIKNGKLAETEGEVLIEQHFANLYGLSVGEELNIKNDRYKIVGHGFTADYDSLYQDGDGPYPDYKKFCLCFVDAGQFRSLGEKYQLEYNYSYLLGNQKGDYDNDDLYNWLRVQKKHREGIEGTKQENSVNLINLVRREDNQRIISYAHDVQINKGCTIPMGIVFYFILAFLIATLAVTDVRRQHAMIGTLFAMGFTSRELTRHFICLPIFVTSVGSVLGTVIGFCNAPYFMANYIQGGGATDVKIVIPLYLVLYGTILPILVSSVVNWVVIKKALSKPAIVLLRLGAEAEPPKNTINLTRLEFKKKYQIRQLLREIPLYLILLFSLLMTIFMVVFGTSLYGTLATFKTECDETMRYNYKYLFRNPEIATVNEGERAYEKVFETTFQNTDLRFNIELIGILQNSKYFACNTEKCKENEIIISTSIRDKFGWKIGDTVPLTEPLSNTSYNFKVADVIDMAYGMYVFTDIDNMRTHFGTGEEYWNVIYSDSPLHIPEEQISVTLTKEACLNGAGARIDSLMGIVLTLLCMGILIFIGMLYMIISIITDKYEISIATLRILGYTKQEVAQMYLMNSFYIVTISAILAIPLSLKIVSLIYPIIILTIPNGMLVKLPLPLLAMVICLIYTSWLGVYFIMKRRIDKISPLRVLREREN